LFSVLTTAALLETGWTVYIGWKLPRHYVANHWDLAWVGLDVAQIALLLLAAWAAWRGRALLILFASSLATLLLLDAWFDITTARNGGLGQSVLLALVVEIPSAIALFWITWRSIKDLASSLLVGSAAEGLPFRKIPLARRAEKLSKRPGT
jgi:hypothetical protein